MMSAEHSVVFGFFGGNLRPWSGMLACPRLHAALGGRVLDNAGCRMGFSPHSYAKQAISFCRQGGSSA